jgi:hypothetical protein
LIGSVLHAGPGDYVVKDEVADSVGWRVVNPTTFHENYKEVQT